jgi:hypothetical protein
MTPPGPRRQRILTALGETCAKIEHILAGQSITLADVQLPQERDPGPSPLERLRVFKDLLNEALRELAAGQERCCQTCAKPLPAAELEETPWAFRCSDSASCSPATPR